MNIATPRNMNPYVAQMIAEAEASLPARTPGRPILDDVRDWFARYLRTVTDADLDLLALWAAHTHLAMETYTSPRLLIDSPVPGSGKTTCLEHLQRLCVAPVQMASVSSPALLVRLLQDEDANSRLRTLLIDEVDRTLRPDNPSTADLLAILNSGYKRGATRPTLTPVKGGGWDAQEFPTYAPVAMAGNSPNLPEDTRSRTIRVLLLPDLDGKVEESDWEMIEPEATELGERLAAWADEVRVFVATNRPDMPEGITGRFRERWQPLARVAAAAGGRWPQAVADMATADLEQAKLDREDGMIVARPHIVLLQHIAEVWTLGVGFMSTTELVNELQGQFPDSWGPSDRYPKGLTPQRIGRLLAVHYKVNSEQRSTGGRTRGYPLERLRPVMERLGVSTPNETVRTVRTVPTVPNPHDPNGSHGSHGSNGSLGTPLEPFDAEEITRPCPECGEQLPAGMARHRACFQGLEGPR